MTQLFLIRHGETEWSRTGQHTSVTDLPLTRAGEKQATRLIGRLDPAGFGLILSSPRRRALHTAELAGFTGDHEPAVDPDLAEWSYGAYEGLTRAQIEENDPGWTIWTHQTPGGETAEQVVARLRRLMDRVEAAGVERAICFSHGHALRALTTVWLGLDIRRGAQFPLDTATLCVLGEDRDVHTVDRWNAPFE
jgi:broad specificity phosphatase PhoE